MSLLELTVGVGIFSMVMLLVMGILTESFRLSSRANSQTATEEVLFKVHNRLSKELTNTGRARTVATSVGPATIAAVPDGDAIWFLSFINPATGDPVFDDGALGGEVAEPVWQRNIMYYSVVPSNHDALVGQSCSGADGGEGYEDQCPHKVLVCKVIDLPDGPDGKEPLLNSSAGYLDRPNGLDVSGMSGPNVESVRIMGTNLLTFRAELTSQPPPLERDEVEITVRASSLNEARKLVAVGSVPLSVEKSTIEQRFSIFPKNSPGEAP